MLRAETHKFESHYIDNLVGKLDKRSHLYISFFIFHLFHLVVWQFFAVCRYWKGLLWEVPYQFCWWIFLPHNFVPRIGRQGMDTTFFWCSFGYKNDNETRDVDKITLLSVRIVLQRTGDNLSFFSGTFGSKLLCSHYPIVLLLIDS